MSERRNNTGKPKDYEGGESLQNFHANFQIIRDIEFVTRILPSHYLVIESAHKGSIRCKSKIGIKMPNTKDSEDEELWGYIFKAIKKEFGNRFQEVFHNTCTLHKDFTIFLKSIDSSKLK